MLDLVEEVQRASIHLNVNAMVLFRLNWSSFDLAFWLIECQ